MNEFGLLWKALDLYRSDSDDETTVAVVLVVIAVSLLGFRYWRSNRGVQNET